MGLSRWLNNIANLPLTRRFLFIATAVFLVEHVVFWALLKSRLGLSWADLLIKWDAGYYSQIVTDGYQDKSYAFFPLYPLIVRGIWLPLSSVAAIPPQIIGALLSTLFFLTAVLLFSRLQATQEAPSSTTTNSGPLIPVTIWGWLFFLYSPASYVMHSHHTEALFLLLSLAALALAARGKVGWASVLAGLTALTRIQGVFLAVAVAVQLAANLPRWPLRLRTLLLSGTVSGAIFALYPLYQYMEVGDPLRFQRAQADWNHPTSTIAIYFKTFLLANPWQAATTGSLLHHLFFAALLLATVLFFRKNLAIFIYLLLNLCVMPMEGEFVNVFRFGAVLFPALFLLGDTARKTLPDWLIIALLGGLLLINHAVAYNYVITRWAY
jgi:Gpi18-like mannosyltransferase